ncbi:MAG: hypothetical protein PHX44_02580 [Sulfurimonas sp.]|uniref:hypothetical protein n=1 Tax=Sulfurimonas sp. TaxID=2022749 RepID=UPI002601911F|nr:hypothetical protein [Sulfurimonas sp.]MDD2651922.1 hypothetical protein [Sulfurimonas sp.]MDD3451761.1 hypothetical protein [Sulfurimonas sp.]
MKDFIKIEIIAKVGGYDLNNDGTFQVQNLSFKNNGELVKNTIKVHKDIKEDDLKKLVGKTLKFENVKEYKQGFKSYYSSDSIKLLSDVNVDFEINREITIKADNVITMKDNKSTRIQSIVLNETRQDLFNITIKDKINLENLKGKTLKIKGVKVAKTDNGTFYSSNELPQIIG